MSTNLEKKRAKFIKRSNKYSNKTRN